ncbi:MAG: polysaccharide deacetylase family protein [Bacteroidia bacterium]|nr:polysaccharide deacetylase family protein [Bacteroidia bacterium]
MQKRQVLFLHSFSSVIPLSSYIFFTRQRIFLPVYHTVSNTIPSHLKFLHHIRNEKLFRQDLDFMLSYFRPVSLKELLSFVLSGEKPSENILFLSFDDGLSDIYNIAAPILKEKGVPATVFINTAFLDNKDLFYRYKASIILDHLSRKTVPESQISIIKSVLLKYNICPKCLATAIISVAYLQKAVLDEIAAVLNIDFKEYLKVHQPYMTTQQIKWLKKHNFSVGSHSIDHPYYGEIPLKEQIKQTAESVKVISKVFDEPIMAFAFPFTDFGVSRTLFLKFYASMSSFIDISFGAAGLKKDIVPQHLHRFPMENSLVPAKKLICSEYLYYILKMPLGKNKIKRKL